MPDARLNITSASAPRKTSSGEHDDATVKAAAIAMRHSSKIQASATYDKGGSDRRVSAAMKVAADYSAKFSCGGTACSSADAQ